MAPLLRGTGWLVIVAAIMIDTADAATMRGRGGETYTVEARVAELAAQAIAALQKNDPERAIPYLTAALQTRLPPAAAAAIYDMRGCAYADAEKPKPALQDANECLRLNPRHFGGLSNPGAGRSPARRTRQGDQSIQQGFGVEPKFPVPLQKPRCRV